jgi:hypothetical protein
MGYRHLVLVEEKDRLVTLKVTEREAQDAREALLELVDAKEIEAKKDVVVGD